MNLTDLMSRYCDGDQAAFRALYDTVAPRLLGHLQRLSGDAALAADLVQVTFLKLHQSRESYLRGADPLPWIFVIARRSLLDAHRQSRRSRLQLGGADVALPDIAAGLRG